MTAQLPTVAHIPVELGLADAELLLDALWEHENRLRREGLTGGELVHSIELRTRLERVIRDLR